MTPSPLNLPPATLALLRELHGRLRPAWAALPGQTSAGPVPEYRVAPVPENLRGRRAELIVEASDVTALEQALRGDADAVVIDFDDTFAPTRRNVQAAYDALLGIGASGTRRALLIRPRALYALEPHLDVGGPAIASLCDLGVALSALKESPPHIYIPKLETVQEAKFWDEALTLAERYLGLTHGSVRVCLQIETFSGLMHADALLHALHGRAYGLNAGRWDYVFSLIKHLGSTGGTPVPPRRELGMEVDAMRAYAEELVRVCRKRQAEAIGGTASFAPDPACPQPALDAVVVDKQREASQGFTAAWAGLPCLLDAVRQGLSQQGLSQQGLDEQGPGKEGQVEVAAGHPDLYARLTRLPEPGRVARADVQDAISLALSVMEAWYAGRGVVERQGRIEDTATAELARTGLWQWVHVQAELDDGTRLTPERYLQERQSVHPGDGPAARLLDALVLRPDCPDYFPRVAQQLSAHETGVAR